MEKFRPIPEQVIQPTQEIVIFEASLIKPNRLRQNKNLHGEKGVSGLTGYWHDRYYRDGICQPKSPNKKQRR